MAQGRALMTIGSARNTLGEPKRAEDAFQEALAAFVASSDFREQAQALEEIAEIHEKAGNHEKAAAYFQECYSVWSKLGHFDGQADALLDLGDELFALGQKDLALNSYIKARALYEQVAQEGDSSAALGRMGKAYAALGQKAQAFASFFQALSLARASQRPTRLAAVLHDVSADVLDDGRLRTRGALQSKGVSSSGKSWANKTKRYAHSPRSATTTSSLGIYGELATTTTERSASVGR
jgi:tetratricopeptide (TPR) repeat protein